MLNYFALLWVLLLIFPVMLPQAMPGAEVSSYPIAMMAFVNPIGFHKDVKLLPAVVACFCCAECHVITKISHWLPSL